MIQGFATPPCLAHAHMQRKETYFAPPIPKHCANGSCHQGLWFLHTSRVYDLALIIRLSWHGALLRFKLTSKGGIVRQPDATMPPLQQLQDFHPYTLLVSTLRYEPR